MSIASVSPQAGLEIDEPTLHRGYERLALWVIARALVDAMDEDQEIKIDAEAFFFGVGFTFWTSLFESSPDALRDGLLQLMRETGCQQAMRDLVAELNRS